MVALKNADTKIKVLFRIKKEEERNLTEVFCFYLFFATIIVAFAPVAKFHSFDEIKLPVSLYSLKAAVLGPEEPWFKATIFTLLIPTSKGSAKD